MSLPTERSSESQSTVGDTLPEIPDSWSVGDSLDWSAPYAEATYSIELPFWLMTADCELSVAHEGANFQVEIRNGYYELHVGEFTDSRMTSVYLGPPKPIDPQSELGIFLKEEEAPAITRKSKTIFRIKSRVKTDVIAAHDADAGRKDEALRYLRAACEAHVPLVRHIVQQYRAHTYDYHAYEVSPWDVPVWFVINAETARRVVIYPYRDWDRKPRLIDRKGIATEYALTNGSQLQAALGEDSTPGEFELLDALNMMERGDYSGAVRRVTTAIEVVVEASLADELSKTLDPAAVASALQRTRMNFSERIRNYEKASGRRFPDAHNRDLENTRSERHRIVHGGHRISSDDRGLAQRCVDTGRWIFNWFENRPDRERVREKLIAKRSLGRSFTLFEASIGPDGLTVQPFS